MKKLFKTILTLSFISSICAFASCSWLEDSTDNSTADSVVEEEVKDAMSQEFLYDFESFELDLQLIKLRENFGSISLNKDANFVKSGEGSAKVQPLGRYAVQSIQPYFIIPTVSELFNFDYQDFYNYTSVTLDVYNNEQDAVNMYMGLVFDGETLSSSYTISLVNGWNAVEYAIDVEELSAVFNLSECKGIYFKFDNACSRDIEDAPELYFDNLTCTLTDKPIIKLNGNAYLETNKEYDLNTLVSAKKVTGEELSYSLKLFDGENEIAIENGKITEMHDRNCVLEVTSEGFTRSFDIFFRAPALPTEINGFRTVDDIKGVYAAADKAVTVSFDPYFSADGNGSLKIVSESEWQIIFTMPFKLGYNDLETLKGEGYTHVQLSVYFEGEKDALKKVFIGENTSNWTYCGIFENLETNRWHKLDIPMENFMAVCEVLTTDSAYRTMPIWNQNKELLTTYIDNFCAIKKIEPSISIDGDLVGSEYTVSAAADGIEQFDISVIDPNGEKVDLVEGKFIPVIAGAYTVVANVVSDEFSGTSTETVYIMNPGEISTFSHNTGGYVGDGSALPCFDPTFSYDGNGSVKFTIDRGNNAQWSVIATLPIEQRLDLFSDYDYFSFRIYMAAPEDSTESRYFTFHEHGTWGTSKCGWDVPVNTWYECVMDMDIFVNAYNAVNGNFTWGNAFGVIADNYLDLTYVYIDDMRAYAGKEVNLTVNGGCVGEEISFSATVDGYDGEITYEVTKDGNVIAANGNSFIANEVGNYTITASFMDDKFIGVSSKTIFVRKAALANEIEVLDDLSTAVATVEGLAGGSSVAYDAEKSKDGNGSLKISATATSWPMVKIAPRISKENLANYDYVSVWMYVESSEISSARVFFALEKDYGTNKFVATNVWTEYRIPTATFLSAYDGLLEKTVRLFDFDLSGTGATIWLDGVYCGNFSDETISSFSYETGGYVGDGSAAPCFDGTFSYDGNGSVKFTIDRGNNAQWTTVATLPIEQNIESFQNYDYFSFRIYMAVPADSTATRYFTFYENGTWGTSRYGWDVPVNTWYECIMDMDIFVNAYNAVSGNFTWGNAFGVIADNYLDLTHVYIDDMRGFNANGIISTYSSNLGGYVGDGSAAPCFDPTFSYDGNGSVKFTIDRGNNAQWSVVATMPFENGIDSIRDYKYFTFRIYMAAPEDSTETRYFRFREKGTWGTDSYGWDVPVNCWYECKMDMSIFLNAYDATSGSFTWGDTAFGVITDNYLNLTHVYIDDMRATNS